MSEGHVLGRMLFDGTYFSAEFIELYENGGVFLADEFDACDSNMLVALNSALANGRVSVPNRGGANGEPYADRHPDFYFVACANTTGTGNGSWEYTGRNQLDSATLDRFCLSMVDVDYNAILEAKLCGINKRIKKHVTEEHDKSKESTKSELRQLHVGLTNLRKEINKQDIRRVVSTRAFVEGAKAVADGDTAKQVLLDLVEHWDEETHDRIEHVIVGAK